MERRGNYIILWKEYVEGCGWIDEVCFADSLELEEIEKAIGKENRSTFNDDAEVFEVKKVKKPLFPEIGYDVKSEIEELPYVEPCKGEKGKISKQLEKLLEDGKKGLAPSILPTPIPIIKEQAAKLAEKILTRMFETKLLEIGENTFTDWFDIKLMDVYAKNDETGSAYTYIINFIVTTNYFFDADYKEFYQVTMGIGGESIEIKTAGML